VIGLDLSAPMLAVARARSESAKAGHVEFRQADAQVADLGKGVFDAAFSRFGVMFFADPPAAFANIRGWLKPHGRLAFVCWRSPAENPFMVGPMMAAAPLLPPMPPPDPLAPGPFAFADPNRVRSILGDAGWSNIAIESFETPMGGADVERSLALALRIGPLGSALREHPDCAPKVEESVRAFLADHATAGRVLLPAAVWIVSARA
jgi:SAM-dependent methyltransferase